MHLIYCLPQSGYFTRGHRGHVTHALGVIKGLAASGHHITVLSGPRGEPEPAVYPESVRRIEVPEVKGPAAEIRWRLKMLQRLSTLLSDEARSQGNTDVSGAANSGPPVVLIVRYKGSFGGWFSRFMRRQGKHNYIWGFEVNSFLYHQMNNYPRWLAHAVLRLETKWIQCGAFAYVVSSVLKQVLIENGFRSPDRILVVPNAGPPPLHHLLGRVRGDKAAEVGRRFLYLGVLHAYYDFISLIRAHQRMHAEYPSTELHLFGDGPQLAAMREAASNDPSIFFHGRFRLDDLLERGEIREDDILVLPNVADVTYGSPTKMFEYMALGLPIIASRVGQIGQLLEELGAARLYDPQAAPDEDQSLLQAMRWVLADAQRATEMGQRLRDRYETSHTWPVRMQQLVDGIRTIAC